MVSFVLTFFSSYDATSVSELKARNGGTRATMPAVQIAGGVQEGRHWSAAAAPPKGPRGGQVSLSPPKKERGQVFQVRGRHVASPVSDKQGREGGDNKIALPQVESFAKI